MSENISPAEVTTKITKAIVKAENPPIKEGGQTLLPNPLSAAKVEDEKPKLSKYTRYTTDMDTLRDASHALPSVYKFFSMIYRLNPVRTIVITAVFLLEGFLPALRLRTGADFIRQLQDGIQSGSLSSRNLLLLAITQALTYILEQSAWTLLRNMEDKTQHRLAAELEIALMKAHLRLDITQMMDIDVRESFQRAQNTLAIKPIDLLTRQLAFFQQLTSIVAETWTLASMTPRRAWIMIALSAFSPFAQAIIGKLCYSSTVTDPSENPTYTEQVSRAETMKSYAHSVPMRAEIILFGLKDWVVREFQKASNTVAEMERPADPNNFRYQVYDHLTSFVQTGSRALMYLLVAMKSDYFGLPLPTLTFLEQSSQQLFNKSWSLWKRTGYMLHDIMAIQELFECMEIQPTMDPIGDPAVYESAASESGKGMKIEVRNMSFKYPGKDEFVLKDISFVLEAGETLALLGFNGSGKSTLIKLLMRLFDPTEGEILINDVDIRKYDQDALHDKMSILFQDYRKFTPLKVSENIGTGDIENNSDSNIEKAANYGDAASFIEKLPSRYNTKLRDPGLSRSMPRTMTTMRRLPSSIRPMRLMGYPRSRSDETDDTSGPVELSGGQWQRLALSRAFMRASSADLLMLDEPSSSLDPEAEHKLFRFIRQVRRNKTTIYVTHRFYTVRMATKIAFFEEGRLIEWGGHDELMKLGGGKYARLYQLQSEGFSSLGQGEEGE